MKTAEKPSYSVSAGIDYQHPLRRYQFHVWNGNDETPVHTATGFSSKRAAESAALKHIRTLLPSPTMEILDRIAHVEAARPYGRKAVERAEAEILAYDA